jgi:gluconate 2-dehydrogenase gamma chain
MLDEMSISRRAVIAGAFVPLTAITAAAKKALSGPERAILEAVTNRLVPHDELGPSASEAGAVEYIDRSLGDYLATEKPALQKGLAALNSFAQRTRGSPFTELTPAKQDEVLTAMENNTADGFEPDSAAFFLRVRQLTLEGMFGDPFYGGNRAFAGWDLIRYPGPRLAVGPEEQKIGVEIAPVHASAHGGGHNR